MEGLRVDSTGGAILVRVPPRLGACHGTAGDASCPFHPYIGRWVRITGHFMDPASSTCRVTWDFQDQRPRPALYTAAYFRQYCREQSVMTSRPVGVAAPKDR